MSSRRGGASGTKLPTTAKGKFLLQDFDRWADQVAERVSDISLGSEQASGGWDEVARNHKNRSVGNVGSQYSSAKVSSNHWKGSKGPLNAWKETKKPVNAWTGKGSVNAFAAPAGSYKWPSAVGYLEAERLSKHFEDEGMDREAWVHHRKMFLPGGQRLLHGYMAERGDIDFFNQHSQGKSKLKFEVRSYEDMVVNPMKQMNEDKHLLNYYKRTALEGKKQAKLFEDSFAAVSNKLRRTQEENHIVRQRSKVHHEENKAQIDSQEEFYKEKTRLIHEARIEKEDIFEQMQQEKQENVKSYMENPSTPEDHQFRIQKGATFILSQQKEMDNFSDERDKLLKDLEEKKAELKRQHFEENVKLEKEFDAELARLMEKYSRGNHQICPEERKKSRDVSSGTGSKLNAFLDS